MLPLPPHIFLSFYREDDPSSSSYLPNFLQRLFLFLPHIILSFYREDAPSSSSYLPKFLPARDNSLELHGIRMVPEGEGVPELVGVMREPWDHFFGQPCQPYVRHDGWTMEAHQPGTRNHHIYFLQPFDV